MKEESILKNFQIAYMKIYNKQEDLKLRKRLLRTIQNIMKEKYKVGNANIIEDVKNSINILCKELRLLYESKIWLQGASDNIDDIINRNKETLCEICCEEENKKYMTLKNIFNTCFGELSNIKSDKELQIHMILSSMIYSKLIELEDLFECNIEDIEELEMETVIDIVTNAIDKFVDMFIYLDGKIDYFDHLIYFIKDELEEVI